LVLCGCVGFEGVVGGWGLVVVGLGVGGGVCGIG